MHRHVGIYPGTFDPVHEGHISFANKGSEIFHLEKVVFLPERNPRRKVGVADISKRQEQLQNSLAPHPKLDSITLSTDQFTIFNTLPELHRLFPGSKFTFFMGSDVALHLPKWEDLPLLLADTSFLVAVREGESIGQIEDIFREIEKSTSKAVRYTIIDSPNPSLRSSLLRNS
jgi:nicotinate-nucleotide adenylyltransferase